MAEQAPLPSLCAAVTSGSIDELQRVALRLQGDESVHSALRDHQFAQAMDLALRNDDLAMAQTLHELHPEPLVVASLDLAFQHGSLEMVQWVVANRRDRICSSVLTEASCRACVQLNIGKRDAVRVLDWLVAQGFIQQDRLASFVLGNLITHTQLLIHLFNTGGIPAAQLPGLLNDAVTRGETGLVAFLLERGVTMDATQLKTAMMLAACRPDRYDIIALLVASDLCDPFRSDFEFAAFRTGSRCILQWRAEVLNIAAFMSHTHATQLSREALQYANVDVLEWLYEAHGVVPSGSIYRAVEHENDLLELYQWLHKHPADVVSSIDMDTAASCGFIRVVQWLHVNRSEGCTTEAMDAAATNGHLEVVQWLHENRTEGCTYVAMEWAAAHGHLHVVQWLAKHRKESNATVAMGAAVANGQLEVVAWLLEHGTGVCTTCASTAAIRSAVSLEGAALDALCWLRSQHTSSECDGSCAGPARELIEANGVPSLVSAAINKGDVALLQYLHEHHHDEIKRMRLAPEMAIHELGICGHVGVVQWFHRNARELVEWPKVAATARMFGHSHIVQWVEQH